ncbi:MAG: protocatechuate 3,4-dioxygenase [Pseudomonadota bacterium]
MSLRITRRSLLWLTTFLAGGVFANHAAARTPQQTAGPFYPPPGQRFADDDTDLVKLDSAVRQAGGEILHLSGRVLSKGKPVANARVEIWQCDVTGQYLHAGDRGPGGGDPNFQGYGKMMTKSDGVYAFRTIKPTAYPGRTPHIHVAITAPSSPPLITQFYVADDPRNLKDILFRRLAVEAQAALEMVLVADAEGEYRTIRDVFL